MGNFEISNNGLSGAERGFTTGNAGFHAELQAARPIPATGAEAHALASPVAHVPGLESAAIAPIPGAHEPISPLIQLIMRMPGHLGLLSSFFEAIGNMILPHVDLLSNLDLSSLFGHGHGAVGAGVPAEHNPLALDALSPDAHILQGMAQGGMDGFHMGDTAMQMHHEGMMAGRSAINVSGTIDIAKPQYEGLKAEQPTLARTSTSSQDLLSGPGISEVNPGQHLAGARTVFSHRLFEGIAGRNNPMASSTTASQSVAASNVQPTNYHALNASGDVTQPHASALNASGHIGDSTISGGTAAGGYGPSGAVSDTLGGKHLLAMHGGGDVAPPSVESGTSASEAYNRMVGNDAKPLEGLKAKELSLNGDTGGAKPESLGKAAAHAHTAGHEGLGHKGLHSSHRQSSASAHSTGAPASASQANQSASPNQGAQPASQNAENAAKPALSSDQTTVAANPTDAPEAAPTYTIKSGDCLWDIAKDKLGDATRWQEIYKLNLDKIGENPDLIHTGNTIALPSDATHAIASSGGEASKYVVQSGDNLWDISQKTMGDHSHWGELYKANSDVIGNNPRLIMPGQELNIPGTEGTATVADASVPTTVPASVQPNLATPTVQPGHQLADASGVDVSHAHIQTAMAVHPAPQAPVVTAAPPSTFGHPAALHGPGGASAANLDFSQAAATPAKNSLVSPSLAPDLTSFFGNKR
jgi:nucleoid-associated protein YgaU